VCRFHVAAGEKLHADKHFSAAIVRSVAKLAGINLRKYGSFSYWFIQGSRVSTALHQARIQTACLHLCRHLLNSF
jgi:hypothetical protein